MSEEIMQNNEVFDDDVKFMLSEWGCLHSVLSNYGINVDHIKGKVGEHIVENFLELMCECGYIGRAENSDIQCTKWSGRSSNEYRQDC